MSKCFFYGLLFFVPFFSLAQTESLHYDLVRSGDEIGEMICTKENSGENLKYTIKSTTNFRMIVKLTVDYELNEYYESGILQKGHAISTLNGVTQKESKVKKRTSDYEVETESDIVHFHDEAITYSIPEIYFKEPVGQDKIFSQVFATYLNIEKVDEHSYLLESEDGDNVYTYENGICTEVKVSRSYATFYIKLKK